MKNSIANYLENVYEISPNSPNRITAMEGLRGLAVILVFFVHYHALFSINLDPNSYTFAVSKFLEINGNSGVDLFFVLSGYLIYGAVIKKFNFGKFLYRRVQRIYPTFLVVLAIYLLISVLIPSKSKLPSESFQVFVYILQNILLLPGIFDIDPIIVVAWSLSYEFFFYLLLPLIILYFQLQKRQPVTRVIFFISTAIIYICLNYYGIVPRLKIVMFIAGILVYEAVKSFQLDKKLSKKTDIFAIIIYAISLVITYLLFAHPSIIHLSNTEKLTHLGNLVLLFITFLILLLSCIGSKTILKRMFSWTPLRWLGNISYSYYLFHGFTLQVISFILMLVAPKLFQSSWIYWSFMPIAFFSTFVSSTVLFVLIEKPFSINNYSIFSNFGYSKVTNSNS